MPITEILNFLIMQPLKLVFEFIYTFELLFFNCPHGIAIIGLSIFMNFALLPMYNNAERIQKENDKKQKEMQPFVSHIKKTFRGAEQTMMLQTYYKENDYKMIYTLKSSLSLLIQIPFFMVAYRFLSNLALLKGKPFGPIQNLAQPDGLLVLFFCCFFLLCFLSSLFFFFLVLFFVFFSLLFFTIHHQPLFCIGLATIFFLYSKILF